VHLFRGANNGINWACLNTECAANAFLWIYKRNWARAFYTALWINGGVEFKGILWIDGYKNLAQSLNALNTARRASIR
jgi:hypothetical protein